MIRTENINLTTQEKSYKFGDYYRVRNSRNTVFWRNGISTIVSQLNTS